jgi:ADP-L-glycero-D-manno-heptose 6-epimerase
VALKGEGEIRYIPFPEHLKGAYQSYTQADISALRQIGYTAPFTSLEAGLTHYFQDFFAQQKLLYCPVVEG